MSRRDVLTQPGGPFTDITQSNAHNRGKRLWIYRSRVAVTAASTLVTRSLKNTHISFPAPTHPSHTPHSQAAVIISPVCVYIKCLWTNTDNRYCLSEDVKENQTKKAKQKKNKRFTLCLCSGISSGGLLQNRVHRAFTKLKIYFLKAVVFV